MRGFSLNGETDKNLMVQDPGSREGAAESEGSSWKDTLVPALTSVQVLRHYLSDGTYSEQVKVNQTGMYS